MLKVSLPTDTSGGVFTTLREVGEQDAAVSAHWPILKDRFILLSDTTIQNEKTNSENYQDYSTYIEDLKAALDDVIVEEEKGSPLNPFD